MNSQPEGDSVICFCFVTIFVLLFVLLLSAGTLSAQDTLHVPVSESAALAWSVVPTLIPVATGLILWVTDEQECEYRYGRKSSCSGPNRSGAALLMASGIVLGPAFGYCYAGEGGRGWTTAGLRLGLVLVSFIPAYGVCGWDCSEGEDEYDVALAHDCYRLWARCSLSSLRHFPRERDSSASKCIPTESISHSTAVV